MNFLNESLSNRLNNRLNNSSNIRSSRVGDEFTEKLNTELTNVKNEHIKNETNKPTYSFFKKNTQVHPGTGTGGKRKTRKIRTLKRKTRRRNKRKY
jgi:hypothetical protein